MPVDAMGVVQLRVDEARALTRALEQLGLAGSAGTILDLFGISPIKFMVPAGGMLYQGGVWFECHSAYDCEVSVGRTLTGVQVTWTSQKLIEGGTADVVAKVPKRYGPFPEMNDFTPSAKSLVKRFDGFAARYYAATETVAAGEVGTVGGLGLRLNGPMSFDDVELNGDMNPNADVYAPYSRTTPETRGATPGGSMMTYEDDGVTANMDNLKAALANDFGAGWQARAMFRDWGDTDKEDGASTSADGGYETAALVFSDMMAATAKPFDAKLADMFVHDFTLPGIVLPVNDDTADNPYRFTVDRSGDTTNDRV